VFDRIIVNRVLDIEKYSHVGKRTTFNLRNEVLIYWARGLAVASGDYEFFKPWGI